jgi:hypothetical protein
MQVGRNMAKVLLQDLPRKVERVESGTPDMAVLGSYTLYTAGRLPCSRRRPTIIPCRGPCLSETALRAQSGRDLQQGETSAYVRPIFGPIGGTPFRANYSQS